MKNLFRYIVAISTLLFLILWLLPFFDYLWLSEEELSLLAATGYGSYIPNHPVIFWGLFVSWVAASLGLFFFIPFARTAFLVLVVVSSIANFFWGFRVDTPLSIGIAGLVALSDGAIIAMAYLTSVSSYFEKST